MEIRIRKSCFVANNVEVYNLAYIVCLEQDYVKRTLQKARKNDLVVFDSSGISQSIIDSAKRKGVHLYDYINIGSVEKDGPYYKKFKDIRIAKYSGWSEYWVDVTDERWQQHIIDIAKAKKKKGAIGVYLDNTDLYWECLVGFRENKTKTLMAIPEHEKVFFALEHMVEKLVNEVGLIVMPNGGDIFVRELFKRGYGQYLIRTVNQEGVLYSDFKKQSKGETAYFVRYLDWCLEQGLYIRGIEYVKEQSGAKEVLEFYKEHHYQAVYISRHTNLRGD